MTCLPLVPSLLLALTVALTASAAPQTTAASNTADATATDATAAAAAATVAAAAAVAAAAEPTSIDDVVYDQRQNGTENVRISLSDLKVVLAPADGLFQIMSMAGAQLLNSELANAASEHRPTAIECNGFKCNNRHRQAAKKSV